MKNNKLNNGRMCIVRDTLSGNTIVGALIVDSVPTGEAKRVRLQTGEHFGESRNRGEFKIMEFVEPGEAPLALVQAWETQID